MYNDSSDLEPRVVEIDESESDDTELTIKNKKVSDCNTKIKKSTHTLEKKKGYDREYENSDNASVLVIILQCETKPSDQNIDNLKWVFSDPFFTVKVCSVEPPKNIPMMKTMTPTQYLENYYMWKVLTYAAEGPYSMSENGNVYSNKWWKSTPCVIVKDSSVCNINPIFPTHLKKERGFSCGMKTRIKTALEKATTADLHFLCKWSDNCVKYKDVAGTQNMGSSLKWSTKPTSSQAVLYTPRARDFIKEKLISAVTPIGDIFNYYISKSMISATAFVPNIIDYDINLATSEADYSKLSECDTKNNATSSTSQSQWIWFGVLVITILIIAILLTVYASR